ncbi:hypothetical protein DB347_13320 [Opitutaceae bacterium EW11]|nr:hypothetical protein DB347_13320 [Opitutaceae bacterium EW11]
MKLLFYSLFLAGLVVAVPAQSAETTTTDVEKEVTAAVKSSRVTIVHLWAPWCPNCMSELKNHGWRDFLSVNPDVGVIFVTVWSSADGKAELEKYGLTEQENFEWFHHPNTSRTKEERLKTFLGQPIVWIPSTWIYKDGQLRYALNYGEVRFPLLQQLVRDAEAKW